MADQKKPTAKGKTAAKAAKADKALSEATNGVGTVGEGANNYIKEMEKKGCLGDVNKKIDFIPTGNWVVDRQIGDGLGGAGGWPRGYMVELSGKESCGKTTLALMCIPGLQKKKEMTLYADFENTLRSQQHYVRSIGINAADRSTFVHIVPDSLEDGSDYIFKGIVLMRPALVVVDSLAAMLPKSFTTGSIADANKVGEHAKGVGVFVATMNKVIGKTNTCIIFINQLRAKIGVMMPGAATTDTTGGMAFKFYMTVRISLVSEKKISVDKATSMITGDTIKEVTDQRVKCTVIKNKIDKPFKSELLYLKFGKGFDEVRSLFDLACNRGLIKGTGWYSYVSDKNPSYNFKIQGTDNTVEYLREHPEIFKEMEPLLFPKVDFEELRKAKLNGEIGEGDDEQMDPEMKKLLDEMNSNLNKPVEVEVSSEEAE
jgi:recombination protein RecA